MEKGTGQKHFTKSSIFWQQRGTQRRWKLLQQMQLYYPIGVRVTHVCKTEMKRLRDATECISLRPDWPKAYYRAGVALNILKRYREAADVFLKGLTLDPANNELVDAFRSANEKPD